MLNPSPIGIINKWLSTNSLGSVCCWNTETSTRHQYLTVYATLLRKYCSFKEVHAFYRTSAHIHAFWINTLRKKNRRETRFVVFIVQSKVSRKPAGKLFVAINLDAFHLKTMQQSRQQNPLVLRFQNKAFLFEAKSSVILVENERRRTVSFWNTQSKVLIRYCTARTAQIWSLSLLGVINLKHFCERCVVRCLEIKKILLTPGH